MNTSINKKKKVAVSSNHILKSNYHLDLDHHHPHPFLEQQISIALYALLIFLQHQQIHLK